MVVTHEQKDIIRSHYDLEKDNSSCRFYKKACKVSLFHFGCLLGVIELLSTHLRAILL